MKLSFSTKGWHRSSFDEFCGMANDLGFEGIELALAAKGPLSMESTDADALRIRDAADRAGIAINAWTVNEPDAAQLLAQANVNAIITNRYYRGVQTKESL